MVSPCSMTVYPRLEKKAIQNVAKHHSEAGHFVQQVFKNTLLNERHALSIAVLSRSHHDHGLHGGMPSKF